MFDAPPPEGKLPFGHFLMGKWYVLAPWLSSDGIRSESGGIRILTNVHAAVRDTGGFGLGCAATPF